MQLHQKTALLSIHEQGAVKLIIAQLLYYSSMGPNDLFSRAKREFSMADHIATVTLPLLRDKKVFLSVLQHTDNSINHAIRAYLLQQKEKKTIRMVPASEELVRQLFFETFMEDIDLSIREKMGLDELNGLVNAHKKSQAELKRGEEYVIVLPSFNTVTVNQAQIKKYLSLAKDFINKVERGML